MNAQDILDAYRAKTALDKLPINASPELVALVATLIADARETEKRRWTKPEGPAVIESVGSDRAWWNIPTPPACGVIIVGTLRHQFEPSHVMLPHQLTVEAAAKILLDDPQARDGLCVYPAIPEASVTLTREMVMCGAEQSKPVKSHGPIAMVNTPVAADTMDGDKA